MKAFDPLWIAAFALAGIAATTSVGATVILDHLRHPPARPVTPEDFAVHPVTCTYSPHTPSIVQCVGDVPIHLEGRRIRLISEPWDGGAP